MKIFKKVSALMLVLSMMLALAPQAQAASGLNSEALRIIEAIEGTGVVEETFINQTRMVFLQFNLQPTTAEANYVIGLVEQAARLAAQVDNTTTTAEKVIILGQIKGLIERAANIFCLTTVVDYHRRLARAFPHPTLCRDKCCTTTGGGDDCETTAGGGCCETAVRPGTPGAGGGGGVTPPSGDGSSPIRQTGLNASTGLLAMLALTGIAGGTGLLASRKKD